MAQFIEVDLDQGTDFNLFLNLSTDDETVINANGYIFTSSVRKSFYSSTVTANLTVVTSNSVNGNISLTMNAATTANIKAGRYVFDVKQKDTANVTNRLFEGVMTVNSQVTK